MSQFAEVIITGFVVAAALL